MKVIINLIVLSIIFVGGYYFYDQNKDELNKTLESVKDTSLDSIKEAATDSLKSLDRDELINLALDNKELIMDVMKENNIDAENIDIEQLKAKLEENGISLDGINLDDIAVQEKIKEAIQSTK